MEEIARFLHAHPPFSELPLGVAQRAANVARIEYFAAGTPILTQDGAPAAFLYIVRRGSVELIRVTDGGEEVLDTLGEGELFGYVSLIRGRAPVVTVRAREETLAHLLPAALFHQLRRDEPAFGQLFARRVSDRLDLALRAGPHGAAPAPELFQTRLADLVRRPLVTISVQATVREAASRMREHGVSALVVHSRDASTGSDGILTDRDLRNRVLAAGLPDTTAVSAVMSAPAFSLPAESLVFEALLVMLEHGIHHLPITRGGEVAGMVTYTDILRRQSRSPLLLPSKLRQAHHESDLRAYTDEVGATVGALLDAGARVRDIGRVVAVAHDRLLVHLLRDAEEALGPPPRPYAWLVLGSEGRFEQTLRTDQDNALVYDDGPEDDTVEQYFAGLAERVVAGLIACGFPRCPGNIMATNPEWRRSLASWQANFAHWIGVPSEEALLQVAIFFDYRQVHGALDAEAALRPVVRRASDQRVFLGRLARAALRQPAPLNFFRRLVTERDAERRDVLDLKHRGTAMIVDLARLFALEAGVAATSTLARLRDAAGHGGLSHDSAEELAAAFELISLLRLRWQYALVRRGEAPNNQVEVARLTALERRELKEALRAVASVQRGAEFEYQTGRLA